jgi:hypothetical protein
MSTMVRITGIIDKDVSSIAHLSDTLMKHGLSAMSFQTGRSSQLREKKGLLALLSSTATLVGSQADIYTLLVPPAQEDAALALFDSECRLSLPGRGSVFSETVEILQSHPSCRPTASTSLPAVKSKATTDLTGVCCIVQRGHGDAVARVALDSGTCVPCVYFGLGTGLRDKLGLLRITIAAEKEVVLVFTSSLDAPAVMNMMIDEGKLDQPGRGFIYLYPIQKGIINTKTYQGNPRHAASMEQIISTLDDLKGGLAWRSRQIVAEGETRSKRVFLENLTELVLVCNEGRADDLVKAAMSAGAAGATISKARHLSPEQFRQKHVSPARETCSMIIAPKLQEAIIDALEKAGAIDDAACGQIQIRPVPKACTYLGK